MLKLKLQYFSHLMETADSLEKTLMLRKIEGRRRRGQQRKRWLDGITDSIDMRLSAGSHHGRSHPWQGHVEEPWRARQIIAQGTPESARACTPKQESVCLTTLCLSPTLLTLTGGYAQPPFSGKSPLRALVNKSPGHERNISILTPLLAF